ncbi:MAG: TolB family protein, partial [Terriglobales bacterium]
SGPNGMRPAAVLPEQTPDGKTLLYIRRAGPTGNSIYALPLSGGGKPEEVVAPPSTNGNIIDFRISPDGHWLVYTSNESGQLTVFLVPYPNASAGKWQVSTNGGQFPCWRGDSKEIFYFGTDNRAYAVAFDGSGAQPQVGTPRPLFEIPNTAFNGFYEVMPDGKRFILNRVPEQTSTPISLLVNWQESLKKN